MREIGDCKYSKQVNSFGFKEFSCSKFPGIPKIFPGNISGIQLQLSNAAGMLLENNSPVLFDSVIYGQSPYINYNKETGELTFLINQNIFVSWWVSIDGTELSPVLEFAAAINGKPYSSSASASVTDQLTGSALISIPAASDRLSLMNLSGSLVRYAQVPVQAGIVIIEAR